MLWGVLAGSAGEAAFLIDRHRIPPILILRGPLDSCSHFAIK